MLIIPQNLRITTIQTVNSSYSHKDELNGIKSANSEINILDSNFVVSVESIELQIARGEINISAPLSKDQDISSCVPFVSMKCDFIEVNDWDMLLGDVYFDNNSRRLMIKRNQGVEISLEFYVYIVEFHNAKINVQSGSFNMSGETAIKTIFPINLSKAFALSYWYSAFGDFSWEHAMVATNFSSNDEITFKRGSEQGSVYGHYFVIEAKDDEFSVETTNIIIADSQTINTGTINSVFMSKSIVISSYYTKYKGSDARYGACDVWLSSNDTVNAQRDGENSSIYINAYIISFSGYQTVQRDSLTFSSSHSAITSEFPTAVDRSRSIIHSPNPYGIMRTHHLFNSTFFATACSRYRFISNDTIEGTRGAPNYQVISNSHYEVVEWSLIPDFELFSDAGTPVDVDGDYNLNWTESFKAQNYSFYRYHKFISEVNNNLTLLGEGLIKLSYAETNITHNTIFYYIAVAFSEYGNKTSNCIRVVTSKIPLAFELTTDAESPDTDGIFTLHWTDSLYADNYSIYFSEDYLTEIEKSVTLFKKDITGSSYSVSNISDGSHYFVVVAYTEYANRSSNVINVVIYTSRAQYGFLPLLIIISTLSLISVGLLGLLYFIIKKYYNLTKFQREIRNLKARLLNGKFKKNSGLTREDIVKKDINKIISSIKSINKRIKENE